MMVSELTEDLRCGPNQVGIKVFEDTDLKKQQPVTAGQGFVSVLTCREKIVKEKKPVSLLTSLCDFLT
jgi:hypothetical protein